MRVGRALPAGGREEESERAGETGRECRRSAAEKGRLKTPGLFLRFAGEDCPEIERAQRILDFFDGNKTVYFFYCDTKKYIRQPFSHSADVNEPMLKELRRILGEDNVIYIE